MWVLSGINGQAPCYRACPQVVRFRRCRRDGVNSDPVLSFTFWRDHVPHLAGQLWTARNHSEAACARPGCHKSIRPGELVGLVADVGPCCAGCCGSEWPRRLILGWSPQLGRTDHEALLS